MGLSMASPHPPSERSTRRCHPERPKRSEGSRRICGCSSPPSSTTKMGCPILAAPLLLPPGWDSTDPHPPSERSTRRCHPERPKRSEGSRRIRGCSSRISLGTTKGCPILAALLFLRPGWDSTDPHPPSERSTKRCHPERPKRSEGSRRIRGCSSRISLGTTMGCPILAALLFLRPGWGSTNLSSQLSS